MKTSLLASLIGLSLTLAGWAEPWSHQGYVWTHPQGVSIEAPQDAEVRSDDKDDSLEITGTKDDFFLGGHIAKDKADAEKRVADLRKRMDDSQPTWKGANSINDNFAVVAEAGTGTINGHPAEFTLGYATKSGKYFVFMTTYSADQKEQLKKTLDNLVLSLRFH